mgnify:FL=1
MSYLPLEIVEKIIQWNIEFEIVRKHPYINELKILRQSCNNYNYNFGDDLITLDFDIYAKMILRYRNFPPGTPL